MSSILIKNATIINEGERYTGNVLIRDERIETIERFTAQSKLKADTTIDAQGKYLIPGVIDDQVHFREPGLTHKATIYTESKAAVAGGVTSFMEMPNTVPQTTTIEELDKKFAIAQENSWVNYSFYFGATNDNIDQIKRVSPKHVCGVKVFMGSSTGNMLVDNPSALEAIFKSSPVLVATHCEDEQTIQNNLKYYKEKYGEEIPFHIHPLIRSAEACYLSSSMAVELAKKYGTRLHLLHLSTAKEMELLDDQTPLGQKRITGEVCVHHLWFSDKDYQRMGWRIKWNPAVKAEDDRLALMEAIKSGKLDVIATDHAPHTVEEKSNSYLQSPSGGPLVQHSLVAMLELASQNLISVEKVIEKMCHAPADLFEIEQRGYIREGYFADLVLVDPQSPWQVNKDNILYKCGWSPFEGNTFGAKVTHTLVNGQLVYHNGTFGEKPKGKALVFNR